jgi:hypothetical protein
VLRLQAFAGNAATSRLLAREAKAPEREQTIVIEGMGGGSVVAFTTAGEHGLRVTLDDGPLGPQLYRAASRGDLIPSVTLTAAGHHYTLRGVMVESFQQGGPDQGSPTFQVEFQGESRHVE